MSKSVDIDQISEILSTSREETRRSLIDDVERLVRHKVPGEVAASIVMAFDAQYDRHRSSAMSRLGFHFENLMMAKLDEGHDYFDIKNRKLYFMSNGAASTLLSNVTRGASFNEADSYDIVLYGRYAVVGNNRFGAPVFQVTMSAFNLDTGSIYSFTAQDVLDRVMGKIVRKMFDIYYKADLPVKIPGENLSIVYHDFNSYLGRTTAQRKCASMGARLPRRHELDAVEIVGSYNGLVNLEKPALYYLYKNKMDDTYGPNYQYDRLNLGNHFISANNRNEFEMLRDSNTYSLARKSPRAFICVK